MSDPLMEQSTFRWRLFHSIGLPLGVMAILTALLVWQITGLLHASQWVEHTDQVISRTHANLDLLVDMETGQRDYLVTGKSVFLEPYDRAMALFPADFSALLRLVADNPLQVQRLTALHLTFEQWKNHARAEIALRREGKDYLAAFDTATGKRLMDSLRGEYHTLIRTEERLRQERSTNVRLAANVALICAVGLAFILSIVLTIVKRNQLASLARSYEEALRLSRELSVVLRASEAHLTTTLQSIADAVIATDAQGKVTLLNPVAQHLTGWKQAEAKGKDLQEVFVIVHEETRRPVEGPMEKVIRNGEAVGLANHTSVIARDGTETPIDESVAPILDAQGNLSGVVRVFHDITERKQADQKSRRLYESGVLGVFYWNLEGAIVDANDKFLEMVGYSREDLCDGKMEWARMTAPEYAAQDEYALAQLRDTGVDTPYEKEYFRKDGTRAFVEVGAAILGQPGCEGVAFVRDITEKKHLQTQLLQSQKMEGLGRLAGGIAHDYNNLLGIILGYAELMEDELTVGSGLQQNLHNIQGAATRAAVLTRQLLTFSRQDPPKPKVISANALIMSMTQMLKPLIGADVEMVVLLDEADGSVLMDANRLEQVIVNLTVNARDAMPHGGRLTVQTESVNLRDTYLSDTVHIPPGHYILMSVTDTGMGMSAEVKDKIFEPFYTTKASGQGTGLGLTTCYGIVLQAGGYLWVDSIVGVGTTMKVYLPQVSDAPAVSEEDTAPLVGGSERVLVVDDEPQVRELTAATLRRHGYTVLEAQNGIEALRAMKAADTPVHLVITDGIMPLMGGQELIGRLRELWPETRVFIASGYSEGDNALPETLPAAVEFLQKPFTQRALLDKVRLVLHEEHATGQALIGLPINA